MKKNQNNTKSENLVHFDSFEETVIRGNSPEKEAEKKVLKKKYTLRKLRQLVSIVSAFAVLVVIPSILLLKVPSRETTPTNIVNTIPRNQTILVLKNFPI